jgi:hypothetical protein
VKTLSGVFFYVCGLACLSAGCAKQFPAVIWETGRTIDSTAPSQGAVDTPVISNVLYNGVFIINGVDFDSLLSVVTISGQTIPGFVYSRSGSGQQTLTLSSLVLNNTMENPAPVVVMVRNIPSNVWPFLFVPQISGFSSDTAHRSKTLAVYGKLFGSRVVPSTLRIYFFDANMRKTYMSPDPAILSWTTNTIQVTMPDYLVYFGSVAATNYLPIYVEVSVSTNTTFRGLLYSKQ